MSLLTIFKSHMAIATQYVFKDGQVAVFKRRSGTDGRGQFLTDDPAQIAELTAEVNKGHPYIHIDPEETTVDAALADPQKQYEAELEARIRAKIISELGDPNQARAGLKDMGTTENAPTLGGIGSTGTLTGVDPEANKQSDNSSVSMADKLANIRAQTAANNAADSTAAKLAATDEAATKQSEDQTKGA